MKEWPILFSDPMILAIQNDIKCVTRRLSKRWMKVRRGDTMWVRETWLPYDADHVIDGKKYAYRADCGTDSERARIDYGYKWRPSIHMPRCASRITLECTEDARLEHLQDITEDDAIAEGIEVGSRAVAPGDPGNICMICGDHIDRHVGKARVCFGRCGDVFSADTYRGGFAFLWSQLHDKEGERWLDNPEVVRLAFRRLA